jgi:hypothetical protein
MSTLNVITLDLADNNKQMISLTEHTSRAADFKKDKRVFFGNLSKIDHNSKVVTLTVITISSFPP